MLKAITALLAVLLAATVSFADHGAIYNPGQLKATDSSLKVKIGDMAPDFELPSITGKRVRLSDYRGKANVVISFVPAAWTPVCSDQWPGYNIARGLAAEHDGIFLGITVDNIPTLWAWSEAMNTIQFPVVSDFWPHGKVADSYGVLRSDGMSERAIFIVDKKGVIRFIHVSDINVLPRLGMIMQALAKVD